MSPLDYNEVFNAITNLYKNLIQCILTFTIKIKKFKQENAFLMYYKNQ